MARGGLPAGRPWTTMWRRRRRLSRAPAAPRTGAPSGQSPEATALGPAAPGPTAVVAAVAAVAAALGESVRVDPRAALRPAPLVMDSGAEAVVAEDERLEALARRKAAAAARAEGRPFDPSRVHRPPAVAVLTSVVTAPSERIAALLSLAAGATSTLSLVRGQRPADTGAMPHAWGIEACRALARAQAVELGADPDRATSPRRWHPAVDRALNSLSAPFQTRAGARGAAGRAGRAERGGGGAGGRRGRQPAGAAGGGHGRRGRTPDATAPLTPEQAAAVEWSLAAWVPAHEAPWPRLAPAGSASAGGATTSAHDGAVPAGAASPPPQGSSGSGAASAVVAAASAFAAVRLDDPAFVRIDGSALPLEVFDDEGFERRSPAEWLRTGPFVAVRAPPAVTADDEVIVEAAPAESSSDLTAHTGEGSASRLVHAPLAFTPVWCSVSSEFRYAACAVLAARTPRETARTRGSDGGNGGSGSGGGGSGGGCGSWL
mmetsp:Transcript_4056/g.16978  ORF Transcript_4056/g.16978 Transcript_4056/m.16978 type:complete len:489 (+) Transcript_4056:3129-4595(+)